MANVTIRNQDGGTINRGDYCIIEVRGGTPNTEFYAAVYSTTDNKEIHIGRGTVKSNGTVTYGFLIPTWADWGSYKVSYGDDGHASGSVDFMILNS